MACTFLSHGSWRSCSKMLCFSSSSEFSEDGGSEGEMPSGEEEEGVRGDEEGEEGEEGEGANDSMSLKAELLKVCIVHSQTYYFYCTCIRSEKFGLQC